VREGEQEKKQKKKKRKVAEADCLPRCNPHLKKKALKAAKTKKGEGGKKKREEVRVNPLHLSFKPRR